MRDDDEHEKSETHGPSFQCIVSFLFEVPTTIASRMHVMADNLVNAHQCDWGFSVPIVDCSEDA